MIGSRLDGFRWNLHGGVFRDDRNHPWFNRVLRNFSYRASNYSIKIQDRDVPLDPRAGPGL